MSRQLRQLTQINPVQRHVREGPQVSVLGSAQEQVPDRVSQLGALVVAVQLAARVGTPQAEEDLFAGALALLDRGHQGGAVEEVGGTGGLLGGRRAVQALHVHARVSAGAEEGVHEGEDDDVERLLAADLVQRGAGALTPPGSDTGELRGGIVGAQGSGVGGGQEAGDGSKGKEGILHGGQLCTVQATKKGMTSLSKAYVSDRSEGETGLERSNQDRTGQTRSVETFIPSMTAPS